MPRSNWQDINERITLCRRQRTPSESISCLKDLFEETGDGMVSFALAEELERIGDIEGAETYYLEAERLFPLKSFKDKATQALARLSTKAIRPPTKFRKQQLGDEERSSEKSDPKLLDHDPSEILFVVSCTKKKIWEVSPSAPEFVPARYAYVGDSFVEFLKWAEESQLERRGFRWMILSGKYGFIEPWHPIGYYDIPIDDESYFPVTNDFLRNQVRQVRWQRTADGRLSGYTLYQFGQVICAGCSQSYQNKIRISFVDRPVTSLVPQ